MLTEKEYDELWKTKRPIGFGNPGIVTKPPYKDYVQNEINLTDYLDLFTGKQTYKRVDGIFIIGKEYVEVGEYPWTQEDLDHAGKRCIKYISLAEAAPPVSSKTYFYNLSHGRSGYFTAHVSAFKIPPGTKREQLLALADAGFLLLDLFPFPISFTTPLRTSFNILDVTDFFYAGKANPASFAARIDDLRNRKILCSKVYGAHCAPLTTSDYLARKIDAGTLPDCGLEFRKGDNKFTPPGPARKGLIFIVPHPPLNSLINHKSGGPYPLVTPTGKPMKNAPAHASCTTGGSKFVPHPLFIRSAFGL